jgi:ATP-dependent Clp protease ATP-binding subunit ClpC
MPRYDRYTPDAIGLLQGAQRLAAAIPDGAMTPEVVLQAFFSGDGPLVHRLLETNDLERTAPPPPNLAQPSQGSAANVTLSAGLRTCLDRAEAATTGPVTPGQLLDAILPDTATIIGRFVRHRDGRPFAGTLQLPPPEAIAEAPPPTVAPPEALPRLTGPLAKYGRDLGADAPDHPIIGRERETKDLIEILLKYYKPNAVLLGEAGVGKTAIVEALAGRMQAGSVPPALRGKRIVEVPVSSMVAGTKFRGQFEERLRQIIDQAEHDPSIILFIDEIHMLVGAGVNSGDHGDASDILKPALARGRLRVIGATTWAEYYESIEGDPALKRRFHEVRVEEPGDDAVVSILDGVMPTILAHHGLEAGPEIAPLVISLCRSELPSRRFPDKALDVLDRACAGASLDGVKRLEPAHVRRVIAAQTGVQFTSDSPEFAERLTTLEERLRQNVLRQDDAVRTVARMVGLCKRRLDIRTHRPDGVFLFVGKSGVGKTELATSLASILYGSDKALIRLDMTGFTEPESVSTLLGSPPGYVNSDEEPAWLEQLRQTPSAVLLLDELEKANPEVTKVFLRAFDEGRIADARGTEYSLSNVTVIATSNVVVDMDAGGFGFHAGEDETHRIWVAGLQDHFAPEFLNRFDEIVPFESLTVGDLGIILRDKILPQAQNKLLNDFNVRLRINDAAIGRLAEMADSDSFGARELERVFRNEVLMPAVDAVHAVRNSNPAGAHVVLVDREADGRLTVALQNVPA